MSIGLHEVNAGSVADTLAYPRLVADVGGTNVRFALEMAPMRLAHIGVLAGDDYPSLEAAMRAYLASLPPEIATAGVRHAAITWVESMVRDPERRRLLWQMDRAMNGLHQRHGDSAELRSINNGWHTLLRMWAET